MAKEELLKVRELNNVFHDPTTIQVLRDINFDLYKGEYVSIMGKSGCGKSTLLYILSTMDTDYEGHIKLNGINLSQQSHNELARIRNEYIGFVFQFHYLLPEFSILENVMMPALKLGKYPRDQIEHKAIEKLKLLDIQELARKKATQVSGGQKQRVAIARALINEPLIIMGDEPTGNLDSKNADTVFHLFKEMIEEFNTTLLIVTHDEDFAKRTDRIITMSDGRIINL